MPYALNNKKGTIVHHPEVKIPGLTAIEVSHKVANQLRHTIGVTVFDEVVHNKIAQEETPKRFSPNTPEMPQISKKPELSRRSQEKTKKFEKQLLKPVTDQVKRAQMIEKVKMKQQPEEGDQQSQTPQQQ